jgi:hypothetical protein
MKVGMDERGGARVQGYGKDGNFRRVPPHRLETNSIFHRLNLAIKSYVFFVGFRISRRKRGILL